MDLCPCRFPGRVDSREVFDFPAEAWMTENGCIVWGWTCILFSKRTWLKGAREMMKELKLDLLPGNLYAAKKREEQQKGKGKNTQEQTNIVKLTEVSVKIGKQD